MAYRPPEPIKLGPWPDGVNNRQEDYALPPNTLRNAINVDIDSAGRVKRRVGYQKVFSGVSLRGGYSCPAGVFFVEAGSLMQLLDNNTSVAVLAGVTGDEFAYEFFDGVLYFSDGTITSKVVAGVASAWGQQVPAAPTLGFTSGSLPPGEYTVAITTIDSSGMESGASDPVQLVLASTGGIRVGGFLPGVDTRVYMTTPGGAVLFEAGATTAGVLFVTSAGYDDGHPATTQFMIPPPAGRIIREFNGRMYVAAGDVVWYTEPYSTDLVKRLSGFFQFTAPVTVVEPVEGGLWIVSDRAEFFRGTGPEDFKPETRLEYGAVYGTSRLINRTKDVVWYSEKGIVMGTKDGQAVNMQEKHVAPESGVSGAMLVREKDGMRQAIVSVKDPSVSPLASTSFLEMEVIRKAS